MGARGGAIAAYRRAERSTRRPVAEILMLMPRAAAAELDVNREMQAFSSQPCVNKL